MWLNATGALAEVVARIGNSACVEFVLADEVARRNPVRRPVRAQGRGDACCLRGAATDPRIDLQAQDSDNEIAAVGLDNGIIFDGRLRPLS